MNHFLLIHVVLANLHLTVLHIISFRCDRIISFGKGMKVLSYRRTEHRISDHRPVAATYMVEVEVFCPKRLQKALSYTDAEIEHDESVVGMSKLGSGQASNLH